MTQTGAFVDAIWGSDLWPEQVATAKVGSRSAYNPHILKSTTDKGQTWYNKSGANANVTDTGGGDSIPYNSGDVSENGVYIAQWSRVVSPTKYYHFNGQRLAMRDEDGVQYLLGDHLGSTSLVLNANGDKVAESRYYPYGETRWTDGTFPTDYRFTGQRNDGYIKLVHMGARFYDPYINQFLSPDTIIPQPANPQSFNRGSVTHMGQAPLRFQVANLTSERARCEQQASC